MRYNVVKSVWPEFKSDVVQLREGGTVRSVCSCQNEGDALIIAKLMGIFEEQVQEDIRNRG